MAPYHFLENIYEKEQQFDLILSQDFPPQHPKNCVQNYQMTVFVYVIQEKYPKYVGVFCHFTIIFALKNWPSVSPMFMAPFFRFSIASSLRMEMSQIFQEACTTEQYARCM